LSARAARSRRQKFGTKHGGKAKLEAIDAKLAAMDDGNRTKAIKKHAGTHLAQMLRRAPLLPFHYVVFDPMHGVHNEANVLLDEAVHKHLMVDSPKPEVKALIESTTVKVNDLSSSSTRSSSCSQSTPSLRRTT